MLHVDGGRVNGERYRSVATIIDTGLDVGGGDHSSQWPWPCSSLASQPLFGKG